jgi:GNAT superfamily N-acetyltransferase
VTESAAEARGPMPPLGGPAMPPRHGFRERLRARWPAVDPARWIRVRPLAPRHAALHVEFLQRIEPDDVRLRYGQFARRLSPRDVARLVVTQPGEIVLVALPPPFRAKSVLGVARAVPAADGRTAEYGILIRSDLKRRGIGRKLLKALLAELAARGVVEAHGEVLHENAAMLTLAKRLGATIGTGEQPIFARATFRLAPPSGVPPV